MIIDKDLCNGCGKCVAECVVMAIIPDDDGSFFIDGDLCNDCSDLFDIECVRVCDVNAITDENGVAPKVDHTLRLRSEHLPWLIAVLGSRDNGHFPVGVSEWENFRRIIEKMYADPSIKVRFTKNFDDNCIACPTKRSPGHGKRMGDLDELYFHQLGIEKGAVMGIWEAVRLGAKKLTPEFLRARGLSDDFIDDFQKGLPYDLAPR